jgi:hypothetical protein
LQRLSWSGPVITDRRCCRRGLPLPQIASSDLDIAVVRKVAAANLPLGDEFEPGPVQMVGFEAAFRSGGLSEQDLEHAPRHANDPFLLADADSHKAISDFRRLLRLAR